MPTNTSPWSFYGALLLITLGALAQCLGSPVPYNETESNSAVQSLQDLEESLEVLVHPSAEAITFESSKVGAIPSNQRKNASDVTAPDSETSLVPEPATALVSIIGVLYLWSRKQRIG